MVNERTTSFINSEPSSMMFGQTVPFHSTHVHAVTSSTFSNTLKDQPSPFLNSFFPSTSVLDQKSFSKYPIFVSSPSIVSEDTTTTSPASVLVTLSGLNITEFDIEAIRKRHVYACHPKTLFLNHAIRNSNRIYVPIRYHIDLPQEHYEKVIWSWKLQETSVHPISLNLSESIFQLFLPTTMETLVAVHQYGCAISLVNLDLSSFTVHSFSTTTSTSKVVMAQWIPPNTLSPYVSTLGHFLIMNDSYQIFLINLSELKLEFCFTLQEEQETEAKKEASKMTVTKKWPLLFADYSESFLVLGYAKEIKVYSLIESAFQRLPHGFTFPSSLMSMAVYGTYLITVTDSRLGLYELKFGTLLSTMSLPITEEIMAVHCHIQAPYLFSTLIQPSSDHVDQWYVQWFRTQLHWPSSIQWIHVLGKQPRTSHPCPMSTFTLPSVMALHSQAHFEKEENFLNNLNSKLVENNNEAVVKTWESLVFSFIQDHPRISMGLQTSLLEWASNPVHFSMSWISFAFHQGWWIPTCLPSTFLLDLVHHQVDIQFFEALIPLAEDRLLETFLSQALVSPSSYLLSVLRQPCSLPLHFLSFDLSCTLGDFLVQHLDECSLDWVLALIDAKWTCLPTDFFSNLQSWTQQRGPPMDTLVLAHLNMLFRQQQADLKLQKKSLKHLPGYQKVNLRL